jgi:uncharacterized membrane protein YeaQ/YmgE (transglycosylase-associated protein family)
MGAVIGYIIGLVIGGAVVGALGRLVVPGRQPLGCLGTILAGIAGSFVAGVIGRVIFGRSYTPGLLMSVAGAALVVYLVSGAGRRRAAP